MKISALTLPRGGMQSLRIPAPREANPEPDALVHARFQYGSKVVGASGGNPGFELPANFVGSREIGYRPVKLDLDELLAVARRAFNAHLGPVH
jgi:hypothetical protein